MDQSIYCTGTNFFKEGLKNGYLVQRADGRGIKQIDNWQPGMGLVDFTNPDAVKWYQNKLKTLLDMGVDCFKTDFGERIPVDVKYYDGSDPVSMHNYYTYLYNKAVFDLLKEVKGEGEATFLREVLQQADSSSRFTGVVTVLQPMLPWLRA